MALLGAGVIAASPIAPPVPALHLPALHFDASLAAAVSPIDSYREVFEAARTNLQALVDAADPGEVLKQIVANQTASLSALGTALGDAGNGLFTALTKTSPDLVKTVLTSLAAGNVEAATNALLTVPVAVGLPLINLLPAVEQFVTQPVQNLINVAGVFRDPLQDGLYVVGLLGPVISGLGAAGAATQNVIDAVRTGDPRQVVNAILTGPATILDGVLNGGFGPDLGPLVSPGLSVLAGGLFSASGISIGPDGGIILNAAGPISTLQTLAHQIAAALKPAAITTAAAVKTKELPAASATAETTVTTDKPATEKPKTDPSAPTDTKAPTDAKASAKPLQHKPSVSTTTKDGNDGKSGTAGPKHQHKAGGRGHSGR
ncbi:hypothetical protein MAIC_34710 [Mycolicibacterium aichiense]|uniref:PE-PGRS family protein n=1 Tax=Mycolicibacterium aichiense TaxID=1799 RepID=A0AAD1HNC4_9MYCO|nr:hypothetical protein MAIC_34710 [Mycolicibacterium aichiense]